MPQAEQIEHSKHHGMPDTGSPCRGDILDLQALDVCFAGKEIDVLYGRSRSLFNFEYHQHGECIFGNGFSARGQNVMLLDASSTSTLTRLASERSNGVHRSTPASRVPPGGISTKNKS